MAFHRKSGHFRPGRGLRLSHGTGSDRRADDHGHRVSSGREKGGILSSEHMETMPKLRPIMRLYKLTISLKNVHISMLVRTLSRNLHVQNNLGKVS